MGVVVFNTTFAALSRPMAYSDRQFRLLTGTFTFSNNVKAGGEEMDLSRFFAEVLGVLFEPKSTHVILYNHSTGKIQAYALADGVEGTGDLSTLGAIRWVALGV